MAHYLHPPTMRHSAHGYTCGSSPISIPSCQTIIVLDLGLLEEEGCCRMGAVNCCEVEGEGALGAAATFPLLLLLPLPTRPLKL